MKKYSGYSSISLTDKDLPAMKDHQVGTKHHFHVVAEHVATRKNESEGMSDMAVGMKGKPQKPTHKMVGEYRIRSIEMTKPKKGKKVAKAKKTGKVARYNT